MSLTPDAAQYDKAIEFTGDTEHTVVTIDIPLHAVILRNVGTKLVDMGYGQVREFPWTDIDAVEETLKDMDRIYHIEHYGM